MAHVTRIRSLTRGRSKNRAGIIAGIKFKQAIAMFYTKGGVHEGIPSELKVPNKETVAALNEDVSKNKSFASVEALMADLDIIKR